MNEELLYTHAEIVIALAGFGGVVVALHRPLSPVRRVRAFGLLFYTIVQLWWALFPIWVRPYYQSSSEAMAVSSAVGIAINLVFLVGVMPTYFRLGKPAFIFINLPISIGFWMVFTGNVAMMTSNAIEWPWPATFERYYMAILLGIVLGITTFADSVLRED